ncbi:MAG: hypothetical protein MASP_01941 [Candidatus Methanolliviera sp. GoM_asphalt]|nr:MAG: hypothetical protein MASP_01941 [Candidatus Methanolliviera sp. GoM_asphalt]
MTKAMGKKTFKEEEEEAEEEEKENRKDHTNAKANNANFSKNNKDGEGKREENHTGDSNFDKCLQYLCEWLIEGIHDPRAPHEVRREIVTRMNLALMRDGVETKKRGKIIFNFLKKNVAWSDYDDRTTAYQVDHIVKNGYNPSNCKKTNCPFKKSCKRRNFWRKDKKEKKEKRKSRFKKGEESFKERRYKSVIDLLPNGNGESIIDIRHLGAGKSTEAREAYDEGVFVYKTIKERDEACARDKNMTPVFSRFEGNKSPDPPDPIKEPLAYLRWEEDEEEKKYFGDVRDNYLCHFKDEIGSNIGGGSRPASCGTCPYCPDKNGNANDPGVEPCKYPPYAKEVLSGEYGKYAVSNKMSHAKAFQKKHGPIVIDDTSVTDLVIDKKVAAKKQLEKSLNILFGEDGVIQKNMEDIWRGEIKKALDGDEESFKNVESKIDEIEYYRDRCIFSGGTIPINIAYLGTAFYYFKTYDSEKEEEKYIFFIENDSPLHKVKYDSENRPINGELKILRYLSSTPAVADAFFLRMYYP